MILRRIPAFLCTLLLIAAGRAPAQPASLDTLVQQLASISDPNLEERLVNAFLSTHRPPIVEGDRVHFIYRGPGERVAVPSEMNRWSPEQGAMKRIPGTDFFYRTERLPAAARVEYKFWVDSAWMLDPWNPRVARGGYGSNSEVVMPAYAGAADDASLSATNSRGTIDTFSVASTILGRTHPVSVYTPYGYDRKSTYPVLLVTDGGEYISLGKLPSILDSLIAARQMAPCIAVFVDPRTDPADRNSNKRMTDYAASGPFLDFLEREVLPMAGNRYAVTQKAEARAIIGASMGGLIATYAVLTRPGLVLMAIAQSPAYLQADSAVIKTAQGLTSSKAKLVIQTGTINDTEAEARTVQVALRSKGVDVRYEEFPEGHNWTNWRTHVGRALRVIFPPQ